MSVNLSPEAKALIKARIQHYSDSMVRVEAERELQKGILSELSASVKLEKKLLGRIAKVFHKVKYDDEKASDDLFHRIYTQLWE